MSLYLGEGRKHPIHLAPCTQQGPSLPPISKATVFVVVSEGVPEAERHAHIIYHISGTFQHLAGGGEGAGGDRERGEKRKQWFLGALHADLGWGQLTAGSHSMGAGGTASVSLYVS